MPSTRSPSADEKRTRKKRFGLLAAAIAAFLALLLGSIWRSDNVRRAAKVRVADSAGRAVVGKQVRVKFYQWFGSRNVDLGLTDSLGYVSTAALDTPWRDWAWFGSYEVSCFFRDQPINGAPLEDDTVLKVEALGSVSVQLVDPDGRPWAPPSVENAKVYASAGHISFDPTGRAKFDWVSCNTKTLVRATFQDYRLTCEAERQSPAASGEHLELTITVPPPELLVRGRMLNRDGAPCPGTYRFRLSSHLGSDLYDKLTTKADGSFRIYSTSRVHPVRLQITNSDDSSPPELTKKTEEQPAAELDFGTFTLDG